MLTDLRMNRMRPPVAAFLIALAFAAPKPERMSQQQNSCFAKAAR